MVGLTRLAYATESLRKVVDVDHDKMPIGVRAAAQLKYRGLSGANAIDKMNCPPARIIDRPPSRPILDTHSRSLGPLDKWVKEP